ncbi:MAG: hypothetical protein H7Y20_09925, partial [Bryobacteraceae bacterium]|nr:hypothetical protein [Bryobacteraceae bacterium]
MLAQEGALGAAIPGAPLTATPVPRSSHYTGSMVKGGRQKSKVIFITLGSCVVALAIALTIPWILLNWRTGLLLVLGVAFFGLIITGVV